MHGLRGWSVQPIIRHIGVAAAMILLFFMPGSSFAVTLSCQKQNITVTAPDFKLANRVCARAATSLDLLASCNLQQTDPFSIEVTPVLPSEFGECFGVFHCNDDLVQVLAPDALSEAIHRSGNFTNLPLDVLFDSLVTHEISHVLAFQSSSGVPRTSAEAEYIAYAMQMESLPEKDRNAFLQAHPVTQPVSLMGLNDVILSFSPEVFAVRAWTHFRIEGNGCEFIRKILKREVNFPTQ